MMPRGKRIVIETEINDDIVDKYKSLDLNELKKESEAREQTLSSSVANIFNAAESLYRDKASEDDIEKRGLLSVQGAYEFLKNNGVYISFRAFGGRIERGSVPYVKIGRKRFIPESVLKGMVDTKSEFFTVREAFSEYKKYNKGINYRAFIGRVEKGSVPSIKLGTRRLIPHDAVDALTHISDKYYSVSEAIKELHTSGIKIKRNAFERRLDRGRVPHVKVGGRRFIPDDVLGELIDKEVALRNQ